MWCGAGVYSWDGQNASGGNFSMTLNNLSWGLLSSLFRIVAACGSSAKLCSSSLSTSLSERSLGLVTGQEIR